MTGEQTKDYLDVRLFGDTNVLFSDAYSLNKQEHLGSDHINSKLNLQLQSEILKSFGSTNESISDLLKDVSFKVDYQKVSDSTLDKVTADVYEKMAKTKDFGDKKAEIEKSINQIPPTKIKDLLRLDEPIINNPIFAEDIRRAKVLEYAELVNLDNKVTKFEEMKLDFGSINKIGLHSLVDKKILNQKQEKELDTVINLGHLTFDNYELIRHLKKENKTSPRDLVGITASDWSEIIFKEKFPVPKGETAKSYGELISHNIEMAYPSQSILNDILEQENLKKVEYLDSLNPLLEKYEKLLVNKKTAEIDWKHTDKDSTKLQQELTEINHFANTFSAMGVPEIINDRNLSVSEKKTAINQNISALAKFYENNSDIDLIRVNFFDAKTDLDWTGIKDKEPVKKELMSIQRTFDLSPDASDTISLLEKGFDSAFLISLITPTEFAKKSDLTNRKSQLVYSKATARTEKMAHTSQVIQEIISGEFGQISVSNINPSIINDLRNIDGFSELFESQNYCSCTECQSILSPAAYFVDVMYFIEKNISNQEGFANHPNHPLHLKNRRSDLWDLKLTCENTNELIPYLTIVNEILEKYLTEKLIWQQQRKTDIKLTHKQKQFARTKVNIYEKLANPSEKISFSLPFSLPLEELKLYLSHFEISLYNIYNLLRKPDQKVWRARLNLSEEEFEIITSPDISDVKFRYGNPNQTRPMQLQEFIKIVGIDRIHLDDLLNLSYNPNPQKIMVDKKPTPDNPQNFEEILQNITASNFDFIHRFIRLWKKTPWSIHELDLVLTSLYQKDIIKRNLGKQSVISIAHLVDIQEDLDLNVEEIVSMFTSMPVSGVFPESPEKEEDKKMFDRIFDAEKLFEKDSSTTPFHHYFFNAVEQDDVKVDPISSHLTGGLGIPETELISLFDLLKTEIPFDNYGNCTLDLEKISLLYRHARLSKALGLSVNEFIQSLTLIFDSANLTIKSPEQIHKITEFTEWQKDSPFTVYELRFILTGNEFESIKHQTNIESVHLMIQEIKNSQKDKRLSLKEYLMQTYNLSEIQLDNILKWVNTDTPSFLEALSADKKPEDLDKITDNLLDLTKEIEEVQLLINNLDISEENLSRISSKPTVLGISDLKNLTLGDIQSLVTLMDMLPEGNEDETSFWSVLENYAVSKSFSLKDAGILARLWTTEQSMIGSLTKPKLFDLPAVPIKAVNYLKECLSVCDKLGISGMSLKKLGDDSSFSDLEVAKNIVLGAFTSKYDESVIQEKLEPYQDEINIKKRDILTDYIISHESKLKFKDLNDLYSFFLVDVDMGSCYRTSRIVAAISSLQLYVHRCLVNLEQSDPQMNPGIVDIHVDPSWIPTNEWEWRKNYQVWKANRKVFITPEHYLLPDLRDDKSPIFKELESDLLQEDITKESTKAAYQKYLSEFIDLAHLKNTGSYYHSESNSYYFFGCSQQDPPQYYFRKWEDMKIWTPWEKIELTINSDHVSAIIRLGKLYLFWPETKIITKPSSNDVSSETFDHDTDLMYSFLNEQGKWIPPQRLSILHTASDSRVEYSIFIFPIFNQNIHVIGHNGEHIFGGLLDTYNNTIDDNYSYNESEVILPNSEMLKRDTSLTIITDNSKSDSGPGLVRYPQINSIHESEFQNDIDDEFSSHKFVLFFSTSFRQSGLQLVGQKPGDFVFNLGTQEYLIRLVTKPISYIPQDEDKISDNNSDYVGDQSGDDNPINDFPQDEDKISDNKRKWKKGGISYVSK